MRVLVRRGGGFLLVRQETELGTFWLPPGGTPEPGETPEETARREFHEETGVAVALRKALGRVTSPTGHRTTVFAGRIPDDAVPEAKGLPGERLTGVAWLGPEAVDDYARSMLALWRE